jgi:hypothetical protein
MLFFLFISNQIAFSQNAPVVPPPIKTYQDYLIMMKALNDVNKQHGIEPEKPLSEKEWKKSYRKIITDDDKEKNTKGEAIFKEKNEQKALLNSTFFGDFRRAKKIKKSGNIELSVWESYVWNI